ncbi:cystathionine beta-lyase [Bosea sp. F3-2]|uniref:cystathionine beta-lyase n=1 Tax=Bosea sp. F3-2 TaxID=2599640 RepID=UPI0011ED8528|nr:cystathionine beta-lyase [Bosea sp. F3-2]QEL25401.1 cystathionine beta-lyase [Bosea sp. F3-2]
MREELVKRIAASSPDSRGDALTSSIETDLVHLGRAPARYAGAINIPPHRTSTVAFDTVRELEAAKRARFEKGTVFYGRFGGPDIFAFEDAVAALEGADSAVAVPSGLAACILPVAAFARTGDHILVVDNVYEPARTSLTEYFAGNGVEISYFDPLVGEEIDALIRPSTKLIYLESPGSFTFEVMDIPAICEVARKRGVITVCDNTWATPLYYQPLRHGVDIVVHAGTKYIIGHSDAMLGIVAARDEHAQALKRAANWLGYHASPDNVYLAARGLRTLALRMAAHQANGLALATYLAGRPEIARVLHPALPGCPGHAIWKRDFFGSSGLFSVVLRTTEKANAERFVEGLNLFGLGFSWGGFESLVLIGDPAHSRTATPWREEGIVVRFHAGLENLSDLVSDVEQSLEAHLST